MDNVSWLPGGNAPPPSQGRIYHPGPSWARVILLAAPIPVLLHWVGGRSLPHMLNKCPWCEQSSGASPARWHSYAAALLYTVHLGAARQPWDRIILGCSEECYRQMLASIPAGKEWRGLQGDIRRSKGTGSGDTRRGRVEWRAHSHCESGILQPAWDVRAALLRVWGLASSGPDEPTTPPNPDVTTGEPDDGVEIPY